MEHEHTFPVQSGGGNGTLPPAPSGEWRKIEQAYAEIQRRDSSAESRTWRAERLTLALLGLLTLTIGVGLGVAVQSVLKVTISLSFKINIL